MLSQSTDVVKVLMLSKYCCVKSQSTAKLQSQGTAMTKDKDQRTAVEVRLQGF